MGVEEVTPKVFESLSAILCFISNISNDVENCLVVAKLTCKASQPLHFSRNILAFKNEL